MYYAPGPFITTFFCVLCTGTISHSRTPIEPDAKFPFRVALHTAQKVSSASQLREMVESSDKYWQGKNVLVTGGGSGIGEALCHAFARRRCAVVVVVDVDLLVSQRVASALPAPTRGLPLQADVGQEAQVKQMLDKVQQEVGKVEAIVANAGIALYGGVQVANEDWTRIFQVNVMQHVFLARHWLPAVKAQGGGHFLITASAAGLLTMVGALPYAVTKHAAVALAEWLAISHKEDGLIVSCLCPQAVRTNMLP
eukprot:g38263.t1